MFYNLFSISKIKDQAISIMRLFFLKKRIKNNYVYISMMLVSFFIFSSMLLPQKKTSKKVLDEALQNTKILEEKSDYDKIFESFNKIFQYPNGMYKGHLRIYFKHPQLNLKSELLSLSKPVKKKAPRHYNFRLFILGQLRLYYFFESTVEYKDRGQTPILKILYHYPPNINSIYIWDSKRQSLSLKKGMERFDKVLHSGLSFLDLALVPLSQNYKVQSFSSNQISDKEESKKEGDDNFATLNLRILNEDSFSSLHMPIVEQPYSRVSMKYDFKKQIIKHLDFVNYRGFLGKSLFPKHQVPIYEEMEKQMRETENIHEIQVFDFESNTLSLFELHSFDANASTKLKNSFFDPNFLRN